MALFNLYDQELVLSETTIPQVKLYQQGPACGKLKAIHVTVNPPEEIVHAQGGQLGHTPLAPEIKVNGATLYVNGSSDAPNGDTVLYYPVYGSSISEVANVIVRAPYYLVENKETGNLSIKYKEVTIKRIDCEWE